MTAFLPGVPKGKYYYVSKADGSDEETVGPYPSWLEAVAEYEGWYPGCDYRVSDPIAPCPGTGQPVSYEPMGSYAVCPHCHHALSGRWYGDGDPAEPHPPSRTTWLVIGNVAEHSAYVIDVDTDDVGFRCQTYTAPHGTVLHETHSREEAERELRDWLQCDAEESDSYCYTHNPRPAS